MIFALSILTAFLVSVLSIPSIIQVATQKKLFDVPDERKVHKNPIPSLGGLAIFAGFAVAFLLFTPFRGGISDDFAFYMLALMVVFFLGLKDDILVISPLKKAIGQGVAAAILIWKGNVVVMDVHGLFGVEWIPGYLAYPLAFLFIMAIVNAYNLIDGIDGLAGTLGILTSGFLAVAFYLNGESGLANMAGAVSGAIAGFLIFNKSPAKIFMGDTGSMIVGLASAVLVLRFLNMAPVHRILLVPSGTAIAFALVSVPILDLLRIFAQRIGRKKSPFHPDRNHIHHVLLDCGFTHTRTVLVLGGIEACFLVLSLVFDKVGPDILIGCQAVTFYLIYFSLNSLRRTGRMTILRGGGRRAAPNVIPFMQPRRRVAKGS